jgi:hypothetical protein
VLKERAMRRRQLKWLWRRLHELAAMKTTREQLLMKLGAACAKAPVGWRLVDVKVEKASAAFTFTLAICCVPILPRATPRPSGNTTSSSSPSKKP